LKDENTHAQNAVLNFVKEAVTWKSLLGDEAYEERRVKLAAKEADKRKEFELVEKQLHTVKADLTKLL
jgi:hypothetical protein